jgi:hypothetical protein
MRVLVMLGADLNDPEDLRTVAHLAAVLGADLHGLFIEDADVFHLAALPVAWEVSYPTATERLLQLETLELTYRSRAREAKKRLFEQAQKVHVRCSFEVTRGRRPQAALSAATELDVVVMTATAQMKAFGTATQREASTRRMPRPVMAIFDGSDAGLRAVTAARQLATQLGVPFCVAFAVDPSTSGRDSAREALRREVDDASIVDVGDADVTAMAAVARNRRAALILLSRGDSAEAERLVNLARCSVALLS